MKQHSKCIKLKKKTDSRPDLLICFGFLKIKYAGADTDTSMMSPAHSFCRQISKEQFERQRVSASQGAIVELLENIIQDKNMSIKDKKKKLKQVREKRSRTIARLSLWRS